MYCKLGSALAIVGFLVSATVFADESEKTIADNSSELLVSARVSTEELKDKTLQVVTQVEKDGKKTVVSVVTVRKVSDEETKALLNKQKTNSDGTVTRCFLERPGAVMREWRLPVSYTGRYADARSACHNHIVDEGGYYTPRMGVGDVCNWQELSRSIPDNRFGRWTCCGYTYN